MSQDLFDQMKTDTAAAALRAAPTDADAAAIRQIGVELVALDQRIVKGQTLLAELVAERERIMRSRLVDAMDNIGMDKMGLAEFNVDIVTSNYYHASLPQPDPKKTLEEQDRALENRRMGLGWLVDNEFGDLIKTVVTVELPRGAREDAMAIKKIVEELVDDEGHPRGYSASVDETVHWATLTSFVKEQTEIHKAELPLEWLGATIGRIAKIVKRKVTR